MSQPASPANAKPPRVDINPQTFDYTENHELASTPDSSWPPSRHRFNKDSIWALNAAITAKRPLLLRGEPGIGKSQFARAVAKIMNVPFLYHVVNERTERDDLLFTYDAVARLGMAQLGEAAVTDTHRAAVRELRQASLVDAAAKPDAIPSLSELLAQSNFICPGVLWWAFDWEDAHRKTSCFRTFCRPCPLHIPPEGWSPTDPENQIGPVILIDEIDKADPSVPNGLLESLGNEGFTSSMLDYPVRKKGAMPLVIITTNEERELPAAFLRRCLVLHMDFPSVEADAYAFLLERARVHVPEADVSNDICVAVIKQLLEDRATAHSSGLPKPGAAEFLDILTILRGMNPGDDAAQEQALKEIYAFAFEKNRHVNS